MHGNISTPITVDVTSSADRDAAVVARVDHGLLRVFAVEEVVGQVEVLERRGFTLTGLGRWDDARLRFATLGDHDLLPLLGARQKAGEAGTGLVNLENLGRHDPIPVSTAATYTVLANLCLYVQLS